MHYVCRPTEHASTPDQKLVCDREGLILSSSHGFGRDSITYCDVDKSNSKDCGEWSAHQEGPLDGRISLTCVEIAVFRSRLVSFIGLASHKDPKERSTLKGNQSYGYQPGSGYASLWTPPTQVATCPIETNIAPCLSPPASSPDSWKN